MTGWILDKIKALIRDKVEESHSLDYKSAASLDRTNSKKSEITKDISSMANASGGAIIYGVREGSTPRDRHLPVQIDPVCRTNYSREWLAQIVDSIRPVIRDLQIEAITISGDDVVYVIVVPKGLTAHQAIDGRYYRRSNTTTRIMPDDEIRDVMSRNIHPSIDLEFEFVCKVHRHDDGIHREPDILRATAMNVGVVYAKYVAIHIEIPYHVAGYQYQLTHSRIIDSENIEYLQFRYENTDSAYYMGTQTIHGPRVYTPILPGTKMSWDIELHHEFKTSDLDNFKASWDVFADNAIPSHGSCFLSTLATKREVTLY